MRWNRQIHIIIWKAGPEMRCQLSSLFTVKKVTHFDFSVYERFLVFTSRYQIQINEAIHRCKCHTKSTAARKYMETHQIIGNSARFTLFIYVKHHITVLSVDFVRHLHLGTWGYQTRIPGVGTEDLYLSFKGNFGLKEGLQPWEWEISAKCKG